jgi:hypothetical protein
LANGRDGELTQTDIRLETISVEGEADPTSKKRRKKATVRTARYSKKKAETISKEGSGENESSETGTIAPENRDIAFCMD